MSAKLTSDNPFFAIYDPKGYNGTIRWGGSYEGRPATYSKEDQVRSKEENRIRKTLENQKKGVVRKPNEFDLELPGVSANSLSTMASQLVMKA